MSVMVIQETVKDTNYAITNPRTDDVYHRWWYANSYVFGTPLITEPPQKISGFGYPEPEFASFTVKLV